ncbi:IS5 family transposase [Pseudovibrio sp. Tun.PSC04-5.I4]|uniref:IS5 family transposase n=1 Tax=Pseudovibrio sp. Tun.PSC04-5.I4 TaxID=1798213 RepID=UPI0008829420|nr:IS5 family transposase [Pseudovibrio sp. Tun.PSC04-5.I4]SDR48737.1 Transposase DDE domain-containing protein [Pseudovibrio sp. Tun.PSC04-5.I4]
MPHKFNASRRHKLDKKKYRVTNWRDYNESLRNRGDLTIWVSREIGKEWSAPRRTSRGGQRKYSDLAIEMCLTLRSVYFLALLQSQGFMRSVVRLMQVDLSVPDFSTLSRRAGGLQITKPAKARTEPTHLVVDSTGVKIYGEGEWFQNKHKTKATRRSWRKLHLGMDLNTGEIVCSDLTYENVGDPTVLPDLLDQVDGLVNRFLADGAYDGEPTRRVLETRYGDDVEIIIPPPKTAALSPEADRAPSSRDKHILAIKDKGRLGWQKQTGYNQRSQIETQMGRWKQVIGNKLKARTFNNQRTETKIGVSILNTITELGRPAFEAIS